MHMGGIKIVWTEKRAYGVNICTFFVTIKV